jgi:TPR repeat protein
MKGVSGVMKKDEAKAFRWHIKASEQGDLVTCNTIKGW